MCCATMRADKPSNPTDIEEPPAQMNVVSLSSRMRADKLRERMREEDFDVFYVRDLSNIKWLSGFDGVFDDEPAHSLTVTDKAALLHTDSRYSEACRNAAHGSEIEVDDTRMSGAEFLAGLVSRAQGDSALAASDPGAQSSTCCETEDRVGEVSGVGVDAAADAVPFTLALEDGISLGEFRRIEKALADKGVAPKIMETSGIIVGLRAVKDTDEIARMRAAQAITDAAFAHIAAFMRPGMTERAVQRELEDFMLRAGAEGLAFSSIVATGANGASPHAIPGDTILEAGQCVVLDFGARARGYCSDMTRTVFLGEPDAEMTAAYAAIRAANEQVEALLKPGVTGAEAQQHAEKILEEAGFGGTMGHSLGHGVGIDIHEEPVLAPRNSEPLVPGNVVTVEPGIYLPGKFGMRLEDFGVITNSGFDVFTQSSHDMVII